jgi:autotransporter-associated beta strand protein
MLVRAITAKIQVMKLCVLSLLIGMAHASVSEFEVSNQPIAGMPFGLNTMPDYAPRPGLGLLIQDGVGNSFYTLTDGLTASRLMEFDVENINAPIQRVEVILGIRHPRINDLSATLQSPDGTTVILFNQLSQPGAPAYTFPGYPGTTMGGIGVSVLMFGTIPVFADGTVTLLSDPDGEEQDGSMKFINDPSLLNTNVSAPEYLNTIPAGTYLSQGDLTQFKGKSGGAVNGIWRLRVVDNKSNNYFTDQSGGIVIYPWNQYVYFARIVIYREGGYKEWIGGFGGNVWSDKRNWKNENLPTFDEINSIYFPAAAVTHTSINDLAVAPANRTLRIAEIAMSGTTPYNIDLGVSADQVSLYRRSRIQSEMGNHTLNLNTVITETSGRTRFVVKKDTLLVQSSINEVGIEKRAGIKKEGEGTLVLADAHNFRGSTVIERGVLEIRNNNSLGTNGFSQDDVSGYTFVNTAGTLRVADTVTALSERVFLGGVGHDGAGGLEIMGNLTWNNNDDGGINAPKLPTINFSSNKMAIKIATGASLVTDQFGVQNSLISNFDFTVNGADAATSTFSPRELPATTVLRLSGARLNSQTDQAKLGNLILHNSTVIGAGVLSPKSTGAFMLDKGAIHSTGNSLISSPINLAGGAREIKVESGTLQIAGSMTNGTMIKRGGGTAEIAASSSSGTVAVSVEEGVLSGNGTIGNMSVAKQGTVNPNGVLNVAGANFANESAFVVDVNGDQINSTSGAVTLNGVNGSGGAILLAYQGVTGTIINGANTGTFDGWPDGAGITYTPSTEVKLGAPNGQIVWFDPSSYTTSEASGSLNVTAVWMGGAGDARIRNFGGTARRGVHMNFDDNFGITSGLTTTYTIPILQNFLDTGDVTTNFALIPLNGARLASAPPTPGAVTAFITISDDDEPDTRTCGFGTGLTVFFLLGFGALLQLRLRRRG